MQDKLVKTIVANYILWPAAHFINFRFVPSEQRIAYNNVVSVRIRPPLPLCSSHSPTHRSSLRPAAVTFLVLGSLLLHRFLPMESSGCTLLLHRLHMLTPYLVQT